VRASGEQIPVPSSCPCPLVGRTDPGGSTLRFQSAGNDGRCPERSSGWRSSKEYSRCESGVAVSRYAFWRSRLRLFNTSAARLGNHLPINGYWESVCRHSFRAISTLHWAMASWRSEASTSRVITRPRIDFLFRG